MVDRRLGRCRPSCEADRTERSSTREIRENLPTCTSSVSQTKFWPEPVRLQSSGGFGRAELRRIEDLIRKSANELVERWHEFFGARVPQAQGIRGHPDG